jgi:hypothetical protein
VAKESTHVNGALLLYHRPLFSDAATIDEHIEAFERNSRFPFWKLNTDLGFPRRLAGLSFDAIVLHYSVFASGPFPYQLNDAFLEYLAGAGDSYKVAFFQDEHEYCRRRFRFLDQYGIDCVYTCFEPRYFAATYGKYTRVPKLVSHVPAYVSPDLVEAAERLALPEEERPIDIGYRTRPVPPWIGRGGMEKVEIGVRFAEHARDSGLSLDISMREEDRLYGEDWYRFVGRCRGFLGTESGASCVDLEDEVREEYNRLSEGGREVTVEELERGALGKWDGKVQLRTTASRHFEAAALRTCQVMYEGNYSGALRPMEHYIPLKKDFSNFDEVLGLLRDPEVRRTITETAYRDLIASGEHSYERFIAGFDRTLEEAGLSPSGQAVDVPLVRRSTRWKPPRALAARYVVGWWFWLMQHHPRIWRVLHVASRPLVWPARRVLGLPSGKGAAPSAN